MGNPELAKDLVRAFGVEVQSFGGAAAILAGYEAYSWNTFHWAGPSSHFAPNPAPRPDWIRELAEEVDAEDGEEATGQEKGKGKASSSDLTPKALRRVRRRKGAPRWTKKLTKLIERHLEVDEQSGDPVEIPEVLQEVWEVILKLDEDGKDDLKEMAIARYHLEFRRPHTPSPCPCLFLSLSLVLALALPFLPPLPVRLGR